MAKKNQYGYVYIFTNPSFREDWIKIGKTTDVEVRLKTLDTTALPLPFEKYATLKTIKYEKAEKHVHHYIERFTKLRIRDNREFHFAFFSFLKSQLIFVTVSLLFRTFAKTKQ